MTWSEWEDGSVKLPRAEYTRVHQEVLSTDKTHKDNVLSIARDFWQGLDDLERTDRSAYFRAQRDFFRIQGTEPGMPREVLDESFERTSLWGREIPRCLLRTDMDYPTGSTTAFNVGRAQIVFDPARRSIRWNVPAGYEAAELAHRHPTAQALFTVLRYVRWTPGTGGWIEGNDDSNRDHAAGSALRPDYSPIAWGPLGAEAHPSSCEAYKDAAGREVTREALDALEENLPRSRQNRFGPSTTGPRLSLPASVDRPEDTGRRPGR